MTLAEAMYAMQMVIGVLIYAAWLRLQHDEIHAQQVRRPVVNDWLRNCIENARDLGDILRERDVDHEAKF